VRETDGQVIFFTSGSTGRPKGVELSHRATLLRSLVDATAVPFQSSFPYEADPFSGFDNTKGQQKP